MKKKGFNIFISIITVFIVVYYTLCLTGIIVFSNNPTISNEPNINIDSKTISSNLFTPQKGDFIVYKFEDQYLGKHKRIHRLVGVEGDIVEVKKGVTYLNNNNFDQKYNLKHFYKVYKKDLIEVEKLYEKFDQLIIENIDSVYIKILLPDDLTRTLNFKTQKLVENSSFVDNNIYNVYKKKWNKDNFGPIKVPKGKVFVLGDNRDYSLDSRFEGFINEEDIVEVVLKVF